MCVCVELGRRRDRDNGERERYRESAVERRAQAQL